MTRRPGSLSPGMQAALERTRAVSAEIEQLGQQRPAVQYLHVDQLVPSPFQARMDFSGLDDLIRDVTERGVLQPVLARPLPDGRYELMAGERRWRASQAASRQVPERAYLPVMVRAASDDEAQLFGLKENLQRRDLNAYEVAQVALDLMSRSLGQGREEVRALLAQRRSSVPEVDAALAEALSVLGRDMTKQSFVRHYLPLLGLPEHLRLALRGGVPYAAVNLLRHVPARQQKAWLAKVQAGEWSVRDVEEAVARSRQRPAAPAAESGDWTQQGREVSALLTPARLRRLDDRRQKKVRRLLADLQALLSED